MSGILLGARNLKLFFFFKFLISGTMQIRHNKHTCYKNKSAMIDRCVGITLPVKE